MRKTFLSISVAMAMLICNNFETLAQSSLQNKDVKQQGIIYKQNEQTSEHTTYYSNDLIISGNNVTQTSNTGDYVVKSGGNVTFLSAKQIELKPGFEAEYGSVFSAKIGTPNEDNKGVASIMNINGLASNVSIYPNPVDELLNVSVILNNKGTVSVSIVNLLGQRQYETMFAEAEAGQQIFKLSTEKLVPGCYFIIVTANDVANQFEFTKK